MGDGGGSLLKECGVVCGVLEVLCSGCEVGVSVCVCGNGVFC